MSKVVLKLFSISPSIIIFEFSQSCFLVFVLNHWQANSYVITKTIITIYFSIYEIMKLRYTRSIFNSTNFHLIYLSWIFFKSHIKVSCLAGYISCNKWSICKMYYVQGVVISNVHLTLTNAHTHIFTSTLN